MRHLHYLVVNHRTVSAGITPAAASLTSWDSRVGKLFTHGIDPDSMTASIDFGPSRLDLESETTSRITTSRSEEHMDQATQVLQLAPESSMFASNIRLPQLQDAISSIFFNSAVSADGNKSLYLTCTEVNAARYGHLRHSPSSRVAPRPRYLFALDLHQAAAVLPQLLSSIVQAIYFLGPSDCVLSITEGRSSDGTREMLRALRPDLESLGVWYTLESSDIDPLAKGGDRVVALAELRNQALAPLLQNPDAFDSNTTIVFINDVSLCAEDILELLHQRIHQSAHMTCGMDWSYGGDFFYDVWISRQMNGDLFFEIPQSGGWEYADNPFWNDENTRQRLYEGRSFQVFSCWNGATAFTAKPLMDKKIKFRSSRPGECYLGEPTHFCKDLWQENYRRIAVVPSINIGYSTEESRKIKDRRGSVSSWVEREDPSNSIRWDSQPPQKIKCVPSWNKPSWVRWDQ